MRPKSRRRRVRVAVAAVTALLLAGGIAVAVLRARSPAAAASPARTLNITCRSPALGGTLPAAVYLPAGYQKGSTRYPVIYVVHGLPAEPSSYKTDAFVAHALTASRYRVIVVAPQGARNANSDREYLNWGPTENWPAAIARDLPRCIDSRGVWWCGRGVGGRSSRRRGRGTARRFGACARPR